jgi:hypothetical protein
MISVTVLLHKDQIDRIHQLGKVVDRAVKVESDESMVIRGIIEAYFRLCDGKSSTAPSPDRLSQEGLGGGADRVVQLKRPVRCGATVWNEGEVVSLLRLYDCPIREEMGGKVRHVKKATIRFPDGTVWDVRTEALIPSMESRCLRARSTGPAFTKNSCPSTDQ